LGFEFVQTETKLAYRQLSVNLSLTQTRTILRFIRSSFRKPVKKTAMKPFGFREYRHGYTRADLAVVVVVATIAVGMLLVVATQQRESSRRLQCERNL